MTLANAILNQDIESIRQYLRYEDVNQLDEYGFTPLIEAAIIDNPTISQLLLKAGADPNQQDVTGNTALHWAAENNNKALCQLLLEKNANPNAYNFAGQPVLTMPLLRQQSAVKELLINAGADLVFTQDYINTKLLGHVFELRGTANIISPNNEYVEVDFEGYYLEVTIGIIADALNQFRHHFAARQMRRYSGVAQFIVDVLGRGLELIRYQQYRVDISQKKARIDELLRQKMIMIPVGYEGHAITFVSYGTIWVKCDRREDSRLYDNVMFYKVTQPQNLTTDFIKSLIYEKQSSEFINEALDQILGLTPITELKVEAQISGNCSWANVEATIPTIFFLVLSQLDKNAQSSTYNKTLALNFFHRFREWNKDRMLNYCIQSYKEGDSIRKACKAEILAAILFQRCHKGEPADINRIESIIAILLNSPYEYILRNYLKIYYYESYTDQGKRFSDLLKSYDFKT